MDGLSEMIDRAVDETARELETSFPRVGESGGEGIPLSFEFVRELTREDLSIPAPVTSPPALKKLRDSHHALARLLATGVRPIEASAITGYTQSRISILQADPAFGELVSFYRDKKDEEFADVVARMRVLSLDALQEIHSRLLADELSSAQLLELVQSMLDRTGHPKASRVERRNLNITLSREELDEIKSKSPRRAGAAYGSLVIESTAVVEEAEAEGIEGEGADVSEESSEAA